MARGRRGGKWIQRASEEMDRKGTRGAFGPATEKNIARGLRKGGLQAKRAQFALNMKRIAQRRKRGGSRR